MDDTRPIASQHKSDQSELEPTPNAKVVEHFFRMTRKVFARHKIWRMFCAFLLPRIRELYFWKEIDDEYHGTRMDNCRRVVLEFNWLPKSAEFSNQIQHQLYTRVEL